jgi:hypothetical protein
MKIRTRLTRGVLKESRFSPRQLSGMLLWLKAESITGVTDGGKLAQWNDLSGNGNHCTQTTESSKPIYSSSGINGKPEVAFTYKDLSGTYTRWMTIPNGVSVPYNNHTIFFVGRPVNKQGVSAYVSVVSIEGVKLGYSPTSTSLILGGVKAGSRLVYHQPAVIASVSRVTESKTWYNNNSDTFAAVTSSTLQGGKLGVDGAGGYPHYGTLYEVLIYNRGLSDVEMSYLYAYAQLKYFGASPNKQVIFDGDSLTTGYACLNHSNFPGQLWGLLGPSWKFYSVSVAGQTLSNMQSDAATEIDPLYSASLAKNILVCWEGLLDVYYGADVATALTRMQTYCAARRVAGWQVVVLTCLPSNYISEENRAALNTGIRNNYTGWADVLADIAADGRIGDTGDNDNSTYVNNSDNNKTHLTQAGFAIVAGIVKAAIDTL